MVGDSGMVDSINPEAIINSAVTTLISKKHGNLTDRLWGKLLSHFPVMRADLAGLDCNTLCTDGKRIYYAPKFVRDVCLDAIEENRINQLADTIKFYLAHELMHVIYRNVASSRKDATFAIPGPRDEAWEILHDMANISKDSIINARLKKEFNFFLPPRKKRDENGNVIPGRMYMSYIYEGDVEKSWTQVFTEVCAEVNRKLAEAHGEKVVIPDGFYENITLFRELYNKYHDKDEQENRNRNKPKNLDSSDPGSSSSSASQKKKGRSGEYDEGELDKPGRNEEGEQKDFNSSGSNSPNDLGSSNNSSSSDNSSSGSNSPNDLDSSNGSSSSNNSNNSSSSSNSSNSNTSNQEKQGQSSGGIEDQIKNIVNKILNGNSLIDNHDQNNIEDVKKKIDRVMNEIRHEAARYRVGSDPRQASFLITLAEQYFRPQPEPWYVGISLLLKNKTNEGPQIRERVQPVEMLTQVMTGNSVVGFDKRSRQLDIAFAVDTSGSMSDEAMIVGVLKILGYLERNIPKGSLGHRFIFAQVDAGIEEWRKMRIPSKEYQEFKKAISSEGFRRAGCGGTRFEPFFQKIAEMKKKPDAVVVFSDMQLFDYPEVERACQKFKNNIVWLCSEESIPDEFYKYKIGRAYDASSMIDEIVISR